MRWVLQVRGAPPVEDTAQLYPDDVGPTDETLCGRCGALLAVDHLGRVAGIGDTPGRPGGTLLCNVCDAVNETSRAVPLVPEQGRRGWGKRPPG